MYRTHYPRKVLVRNDGEPPYNFHVWGNHDMKYHQNFQIIAWPTAVVKSRRIRGIFDTAANMKLRFSKLCYLVMFN